MRERILEKAYELIQRYGLRGFTMDDVAGELGISKKTIYKSFASKNQLISRLVDNIVEVEKKTFTEAVSGHSTWLEKFEAMLTMYTPEDIPFRLVDELYRYYPEEKEKIERLAEFRQEIFYPLIQEGQATGKIRLDLNPAIIVSMIHNLFMMPADPKMLESQDITIKQLLEQMKNLVFYGILNHGEDNKDEV
ncbi:TetR/AcrR family transcriptional regulator [Desulfitobacterium chlororespirans]|uniref:Transcriptional regulator, TetR family n=1 Tax=Desulfitobacterium chlororespirans DSM 11544 TaxID=1121395 RepID=A0A1M7UQA2_9FIRM|nr:TetR/AcrR family transcriptional regulator [Desulfitobacterium chlororespirans]SHN85139.1 transcriptional regulator, TetR family [Desulfitobacterium chlororespirans DSM 11544]